MVTMIGNECFFWSLLIGVCSCLVNCEPIAQPTSLSSLSSSPTLSNTDPLLAGGISKWTNVPTTTPTYLKTPFQQLLERLLQQRLDQTNNDLIVHSAFPGILSAALAAQSSSTSFNNNDPDNAFYYKRADNSPGWNKLQGGWGKRQPTVSSVGSNAQSILSTNTLSGQPSWAALVNQREPVRRSGSWNHLNALWGRKRSAPLPAMTDNGTEDEEGPVNAISVRAEPGSDRDWNSLNSMWGKRRRRGWNDLQGGWGKRSSANWNQLSSMWGKRSV